MLSATNQPPHSRPQPDSDLKAAAAGRLLAAARLFMGSLVCLGVALGAFGDLFFGAVITVAGLFGWRGLKVGAIQGLFALISVLCVYAWSVPTGKWLSGMVRVLFDVPRAPNRFICILVSAAVMICLGQICGRLFSAAYKRRHGVGVGRVPVLGMALGIGEGIAISVTLLVVLVAIEPAVMMGLSLKMNQVPWARSAYRHMLKFRQQRESTLIAGPLSHAYHQEQEVLEMGTYLAAISKYPGAVKALDDAEQLQGLLCQEPALKSIRRQIKQDSALKQALKQGDLGAILNSPTVIRILDDRELAEALKVHRDELLVAMLNAVPDRYRTRATEEFAYLSGLPPNLTAAGLRRRLEQARPEADRQISESAGGLIQEPETEITTDLDRKLREAAKADEAQRTGQY